MTTHNDNGANVVVTHGANLEIDASVGGKFSHGGTVFSNADSIVLNAENHGITVSNTNNIGSITNAPTSSVPAVTLTITPGYTVNLGSVGTPTDLSNGAVAFVRIDQPTLVTDGRGMSFVVTPNDVPATITVSANHEVSSLGDAAHTDSVAE